MRIISGKLKGKSINFVKSKTTRPLKDTVKENIFNIVKHSNILDVAIEKASVLDLYSGIGSFGLESISRGADKITFVEKDKTAIEILKKNVINLSIEKKVVVVDDEIKNFLHKDKIDKFNIIFLDPPFADKSFFVDLKLIKQKKIYKKKHIVIIHRERKSDDNFDEILKTIIVRNYGRSKIIFAKFSD
jgi:16S rRNA (guanine966-N2)-methyltransferase